ncbi:hypothetical protein V8E54_012270 [Elaphomyces granulatus]
MAPRARGRRGRGGSSSRRGSDRAPTATEPKRLMKQWHKTNESSPSPTASDEDRVATASDPIPITVHGEKYHKAEDLAGKRKGRKKAIWQHGFEIVHVEHRTRHYYCCGCLDEGKDPSYKPLVLAGNSSALAHFRSQVTTRPTI